MVWNCRLEILSNYLSISYPLKSTCICKIVIISYDGFHRTAYKIVKHVEKFSKTPHYLMGSLYKVKVNFSECTSTQHRRTNPPKCFRLNCLPLAFFLFKKLIQCYIVSVVWISLHLTLRLWGEKYGVRVHLVIYLRTPNHIKLKLINLLRGSFSQNFLCDLNCLKKLLNLKTCMWLHH